MIQILLLLMENNNKAYPITDEVWMVPCKILGNKKSYIPLVRPFIISKAKLKSLKLVAWNSNEDEILNFIVKEKNSKAWSSIAKEINNKVHKGLEIRNGRQCREL